MQNLAWAYHIGLSTVFKIINETCTAICKVLMDEYLKQPTKEDYLKIPNDFLTNGIFQTVLVPLMANTSTFKPLHIADHNTLTIKKILGRKCQKKKKYLSQI